MHQMKAPATGDKGARKVQERRKTKKRNGDKQDWADESGALSPKASASNCKLQAPNFSSKP